MSKAPAGFDEVPDPFGQVDLGVEEYQPPAVTASAWERQQPAAQPASDILEDDEPFTAAHLAASSNNTVPAVVPAVTGAPQAAPALPFTASVGPAGAVGGRMGPAVPAVPRLGSAPDTSLLMGNAPELSAPAPTGPPEQDPSSYPFYNIKRYRTYFNVDTEEVLQRAFRAVAMFFKGDFFDHVGGNPDL